jgi:polar amino acid transport system substrate-binding protein
MKKAVSQTIIILAVILLTVPPAWAVDRMLKIGGPDDIPPFFLADGSGVVPDIFRAVFKLSGDFIEFQAMGNQRIVASLGNGNIDIAPFAVSAIEGVYFSHPYLTFLNAAITRKSKGIVINSVADLAGLKVAGFQGATTVFGDEYKQVVENEATFYNEMADQDKQMKVFWKNRVDVVVLDKLIFDFRSFVVDDSDHSRDDVIYHYIFGEGTTFPAVFNDPALRDQFDEGFSALSASGEIQAIYDRYLQVD